MGMVPADLVVPLASLLGLGFLGIVAAFGQWWGRRVPVQAQKTFEVAGALVDSQSVKMLTAALEAHTLELVTHRAETARDRPEARAEAEKARAIAHKLVDALGRIADELEELRRAADGLSREIARK